MEIKLIVLDIAGIATIRSMLPISCRYDSYFQ